MQKKIETGIVFDFDDTLVNTSHTILKRLFILVNKYGIDEGVMYLYNLLLDERREDILGRRYADAKGIWSEYEKLRRKFQVTPFPGVREKIQTLKQKGAPLGIITRTKRRKIDLFLKEARLSQTSFPLGIYTSENNPFNKPNTKCFDLIKERCDSPLVYIGDELQDLRVAKDSGLEFVAVCTGMTNKEAFLNEGLQSSRIFPCLSEVQFETGRY